MLRSRTHAHGQAEIQAIVGLEAQFCVRARVGTRSPLLSWPLWPSEWKSQWEVPGLMADSSHRHAPQAMISRQGFLNLSGDVCFVPCYFRKNELHDRHGLHRHLSSVFIPLNTGLSLFYYLLLHAAKDCVLIRCLHAACLSNMFTCLCAHAESGLEPYDLGRVGRISACTLACELV